MKMRLFYTTDPDDAPERIKLNLEHSFEEAKLQKKIKELLWLLEQKTINHLSLVTKIDDLRRVLYEFDFLLGEVNEQILAHKKVKFNEFEMPDEAQQAEETGNIEDVSASLERLAKVGQQLKNLKSEIQNND